MRKAAKREPANTSGSSRERVSDNAEQLRSVKREKVSHSRVDLGADDESTQASQQDTVQRRVLRSKYLAVMNKINDQRDDLSRIDSQKFNTIINEVENLHQLVQKPREQVTDAEALLDIANTLVSSVQSQSNAGVTPTDFVSCLISEFGQSNGRRLASQENTQISINWEDIGLAISPFLSTCHGCCTMIGPMNSEVKQRKKIADRRKHEKPTQAARPEEVDSTEAEKKTDTDKNMSIMFEILRRKKRVRLESLILNRMSFAQTVENMFALSFLVKDGRIEITVDENGSHIVAPRNAPSANAVMSGDVTYKHFVFRFDYKDWKLMMDAVPAGEELMPHREKSNSYGVPQAEPAALISQAAALCTTPIKKLSRNRGLVIREESVVEDSPELEDAVAGRRATNMLRCKRKLI
ncbi:non-structural maintenance of chromosomes element 4 homolog A-like [Mangifera indica]|uniref:non-structural maintenance of chromosomes element 4 homolog A-like n=1 Tax=Mangifera indica TaxID=29780 RepID=UPI001CFBAAC4|nr:non-structural maintenance of chromosomes element 4 homolog A-like [Mangifera indica]